MMDKYFGNEQVLVDAMASIDAAGESISASLAEEILAADLLASWDPKTAATVPWAAALLATTFVKDMKQKNRNNKRDKEYFDKFVKYSVGQFTKHDELLALGDMWVSAGKSNPGQMVKIKDLTAEHVMGKVDDHQQDAKASAAAAAEYEPSAVAYCSALTSMGVVKASEVPGLYS